MNEIANEALKVERERVNLMTVVGDPVVRQRLGAMVTARRAMLVSGGG